MTEIDEVRLEGKLIGYAFYNTTADLWLSPMSKTRDHEAVIRALNGSLISGKWRCTCSSTSEYDNPKLVWVDVSPGDIPGCRLLACLTCMVLVPPPYDGYTYLPYPPPWKEVS
jgi:hypothetical protein